MKNEYRIHMRDAAFHLQLAMVALHKAGETAHTEQQHKLSGKAASAVGRVRAVVRRHPTHAPKRVTA